MTTDSTDIALALLLSIDAICTSSPMPMNSSPDFTDWLHISPRPESPAPAHQSDPAISSDLQDITTSSKVNALQEPGLHLNYLYNLSDISDANATESDAVPSSMAPGVFNRHHRMISLESTSQTLINTPSPLGSPAFFFPSESPWHATDDHTNGIFSPLISPPGSKSFLNYFCDLAPATPSQPTISMSDISPVVRANTHHGIDVLPPKRTKNKRKTRRHKPDFHASSFVDKLQAVPPLSGASSLKLQGSRGGPPVPDRGIASAESTLLSPCRLEPSRSRNYSDRVLDNSLTPEALAQDRLVTPPSRPYTASVSSLSPLTPLSSSPRSPIPPLKIVLKLKRKVVENATPLRRSKRPKTRPFVPDSPISSESETLSRPSSPEFKSMENLTSVHSIRTLPESVQVSDNFPLFYRRFPASTYYRLSDVDPPLFLSNMSHPGGVYNPPRFALDLYTPRFVRGKGVEKVGLCPICIEPHSRGGEHKKLWFAMKFSAFKYYHMQYAHGISASTGRPFSPPVEFRITARLNPGKKEKHSIQQGKCHKCTKWVAVEGIKDMESKVKELHWWKHAAACHQDSTLEGEDDLYEDDVILSAIRSFKPVGTT